MTHLCTVYYYMNKVGVHSAKKLQKQTMQSIKNNVGNLLYTVPPSPCQLILKLKLSFQLIVQIKPDMYQELSLLIHGKNF